MWKKRAATWQVSDQGQIGDATCTKSGEPFFWAVDCPAAPEGCPRQVGGEGTHILKARISGDKFWCPIATAIPEPTPSVRRESRHQCKSAVHEVILGAASTSTLSSASPSRPNDCHRGMSGLECATVSAWATFRWSASSCSSPVRSAGRTPATIRGTHTSAWTGRTRVNRSRSALTLLACGPPCALPSRWRLSSHPDANPTTRARSGMSSRSGRAT